MTDNQKKATTYSLLSHIRNSGTFVEGPIDYFLPLAKRALNSLNTKGIKAGKSIIEISDEITAMFSLEIPIPVLSKILAKIQAEENVSGEENFKLYSDHSYQIKKYYFYEYEQLYQEKSKEIFELNNLFKEFCQINEYKTEFSIVEYIDKNKKSLLKHLNSDLKVENTKNGVIEAKFIDYFKNIPNIFDLIKNIYLGSLISTYLEFEISEYKDEVELLLDTNFVISLMDLNTTESTKTCEKVIELSRRRGYKISLMNDTIKEIQQLLYKKAENINNSTLIKYVNPEDILNACERRGLNKVDLERIADNIQDTLNKMGFFILFIQDNMRSKAKQTEEYKSLKEVRLNKVSALHDATALLYVKEKRGKKVTKFEQAKCWFVNNSINNIDTNEGIYQKEFISESIRADELLSVLWLSNPEIKKELNEDEFAEIGLNSMISISLNSSIPKSAVIKELEDNIFKYSGEDITEKDILNLATRITNSQIKNVQELNEIASEDNKIEFVKRIKEESDKQELIEKNKNNKLAALYTKLEKKIKVFDKKVDEYSLNSNLLGKENLVLQDEVQELKKQLEWEKINSEVKKWQIKSVYMLLFSLLLFVAFLLILGFFSNWNLIEFYENLEIFKKNIILRWVITGLYSVFNVFVLANVFIRYYNESNIKAYKEKLQQKLK
ncbi:hypothetical protein [Chryseobacterium sp. MFBS3-17]|uniref:hypothetical protein n=1 Tax=Chryseobacterium sp. MFBS3-17 TaxID=2886689 RepID=UPI001D0E9303|nr:hypothetical protein [Chryseobacterium sp. MFBS3-17]MCC2591180.1 hypothetical protein [Chryseobacterium sp. MFBS3-17]